MMNFQTLFALGMKRYLPPLLAPEGIAYDIGSSGKYRVPGVIAIGAPDWVWPRDKIPAANNSVAVIHAYHFLEHLTGADAISLLREVERVLISGGVMNFSVPYHTSTLFAHDLDHKSRWCEDTFDNLFHDESYHHDGPWELNVHFLVMVGIVQRNLSLVGQLVKGPPPAPREKWYYPQEGPG